jgi:enoyl-[acyl-carrier protein] reductase II
VRSIKNKLTRAFDKAERDAFKQENPDLTVFEEMGVGRLPASVIDGDVENGSVMAGQIAGLISKEETAEEILKDLYEGAKKIMAQEAKKWLEI